MTKKISAIQLSDTLMLRVLIEALHRTGTIDGRALYDGVIKELHKMEPSSSANVDKKTIQEVADRLLAAMLTLPD